MRTAANVEVTTDSEKAAAAFFEEVHRLLGDFNVALQDESKDRKYRFVTKRLMKANQRQGDEVCVSPRSNLLCLALIAHSHCAIIYRLTKSSTTTAMMTMLRYSSQCPTALMPMS